MGSIIHSVAVEENQMRRGYLHAGSKAINRCISEAGIEPNQVGMLINTGVYSDNHIQEPAFAALLQGKTEMEYSPDYAGILSYDLHDGGGGMVMAFRILNGYLESGKIEFGLVVAGDTVPIGSQPNGYNYSEQAGAILLGKGKVGTGFMRFIQDIYPQYSKDFNSYTHYLDGVLKTFINKSDKYLINCVQCVRESVSRFLSAAHLKMQDLVLMVPSQSPVGFAAKMGQLYGDGRVIVINGEQEHYSAGLALALESAMKSHQFSKAKRTLFVSVGAGITVNLALYEH